MPAAVRAMHAPREAMAMARALHSERKPQVQHMGNKQNPMRSLLQLQGSHTHRQPPTHLLLRVVLVLGIDETGALRLALSALGHIDHQNGIIKQVQTPFRLHDLSHSVWEVQHDPKA